MDAAQSSKILDKNIAKLEKKLKAGKKLTAHELLLVQSAINGGDGKGKAWAKNQVELAEVLGVDRKTIQRWRKVGGNPGKQSDGRYNIPAWKEFARLRGHALDDDGGLNQTSLKARQILLQNMKLEFEISILRKEHVSVVDVEKWGGELGAAIRKVVMQLRKLAPTLTGLTAPEIEKRLLDAELSVMQQLHTLDAHVADMKAGVIANEPTAQGAASSHPAT